MSFAGEQLFNGYIRTHMPVLVSRVRVREIIPHLPCLTLSDREEIEAKREISGNFTAMQLLLDCLHRRENWPEEFIRALQACEHRGIAAEIQAEYRRLKTPSPPNPSTVVLETVDSPPPVSQPAPTGSSPLTETPGRGSDSEPGARTPPRGEALARQEPEENSECDDVSVGSEFTAQTGSPAQPESMGTWRSPEESEPPSACSDDSGSASITMTLGKLPVQDSERPNLREPVQVESSVQPRGAAPPPECVDCPVVPGPGPALGGDEDDVCFSKPLVLLSLQPNPAQPAMLPNTLDPTFSGNISLQISDLESEGCGTHPQGSLGDPPQENPCVSHDLASFAEQEAQEVLEHVGHVMEEPSLQNLASPTHGILGNAVHASQDPRRDENNEGQRKNAVQSPSSSSPPLLGGDGGGEPQILNGKPTPALAHEQVPACQHRSAAAKLQPDPEAEAPGVLSARTKYVLTAAGVAASAMLVAWRLKN